VPDLGLCAREIYYQALVEADGPLTPAQVHEAVRAHNETHGLPVLSLATTYRVLAGLAKDGVVSRASRSLSGPRIGDTRPRVTYEPAEGVEGLWEILRRSQTVRVVSAIEGQKTTGVSPRRATTPSRLAIKVPGYLFEPRPRQRINRLIEDGSWENKAINWFNEDGVPIRRWRWSDQREIEAERARSLRSKTKTA
jgi:hypothetical protein